MSPELLSWLLLALVVGSMLALDLLVLHREAKPVPFREAAAWSAVWISIALAFGAFVWLTRGGEAGGEYLAGYLIELSLSVDNVFVFALIFAAFAVPAAYQHRLLFWGILGAVVFRAAFIAAGTAVLAAAHWVIYLLGALLVVTGIRLARSRGHAVDPARNPVLRLFRRIVPTADEYDGPAFIVRRDGRRLATPMLAVLIAIETTDIAFALDSIPAVFAVTTDAFIVFSSNLFAILGLRSLYFLLAGLLERFVYLKTGLAALLVFAGVKILLGIIHVEIPVGASLGAIVLILGTAVVASLVATHPSRDGLRVPLLRIGAGMGLGLLVALLLAGVTLVGDATVPWILLDALVLVAIATGVVVGYLALRHEQPGSPAGRAWMLAGSALLVLAGALVALD